jgi:hypothetical protein
MSLHYAPPMSLHCTASRQWHDSSFAIRGKHLPPCYSSKTVQPHRKLSIVLVTALLLPGCKREDEIITYSAPKPPQQSATSPSPVAAVNEVPPPEIPGVIYTAPAGWVSVQPHQFEAARFDPAAGDGKTFFTISLVGPQLDLQPNIERWEKQVGSDPTPASAQASIAKSTTLGGGPAHSLDLKGPKGRLLVVVSPQPDKTVIFKLMGAQEKVEALKPVYDAFLQSVRLEAVAPPAPAVAETPRAPSAPNVPFSFSVPSDWQPDSRPNAFRVLSWNVGTGSKSEIFVTGPLTAATFDLASNLQRWRNQVDLTAPASATDTKATEVRVGDQAGTMVDLTGPGASPKRLIVAYVGKDDLWFFKIQGPADAVAQQKPAFEKFLASIKFKTPA